MRIALAAWLLATTATVAAAEPTEPAAPQTQAAAAPAASTAFVKADASEMHADDCARARAAHKTCVIDMGKGDTVDGDTVKPTGTGTALITFGTETSLVRVRHEFIVQILKTAQDL